MFLKKNQKQYVMWKNNAFRKKGRENIKYGIANFNIKGLRSTNISYETNTWEKVGPLINEETYN